MAFNHDLSIYGVLSTFQRKAYSSSAMLALVATGIASLAIMDSGYNRAFAADVNEIYIAPSNLSNYLEGTGGYLLKTPNEANTVYILYNNDENTSYPILNRLTINHSDITLQLQGQNNNGRSDSLKVNQFIIENGALAVEAGPGLSFEVGRFLQQGGNSQISSQVNGQIGLKANNVVIDMLTGSFSAFAKAGTAVKGDLTLQNGAVTIETNAAQSTKNELPVGWQGSVRQSGGRLSIFNRGGIGLSGSDYILSGGSLNITARNPQSASQSTGIAVSDRFSQSAGSNIISADGNDTTGVVLQQDAGYVLSGDDSQMRVTAQRNAIGLKSVLTSNDTINNSGDAFTQNGGDIAILAKTRGKGFYLERGGVNLNKGSLTIDASEAGTGIEIANSDESTAGFTLNDGSVKIIASGENSIGLKSNRVDVNGGSLDLLASDNGKAIDIGSGQFNMQAGNLYLRQNSTATQGWAIYGDDNSSAFFGKDAVVETIIDLDAAKQKSGLMSFGNVTIEEGSKLQLGFANTATVLSSNFGMGRSAATSAIETPFLESRNTPIAGQFDAAPEDMAGETLFYNYQLVLSESSQDYRLVMTPKSTGDNGAGNGSSEGGGSTGGDTGSGSGSGGSTGGNGSSGSGSGGSTGGNGSSGSGSGGSTGGNSSGGSESGGSTGSNGSSGSESGGSTSGNSGGGTESSGSTTGNTEAGNNPSSNNNGNSSVNNNQPTDNGSNGSNDTGGDLLLPSHLLSGANKNASLSLENILRLDSDKASHTNLNRAFDKLYNSRNNAELEQRARGLTAHDTTRLPSLTMAMHDRMTLGLQSELDKAAQQTEVPVLQTPLAYVEPQASPSQDSTPFLEAIPQTHGRLVNGNDKNAPSQLTYWARPMGASDRYRAQDTSHSKLDVNYGGISAGVTSRLETMTFGVSAGYLHGDLSGAEGYRAKSNSFLLTAGLQTDNITLTDNFAPRFSLIGAYGHSQYDQNRSDTLGGRNQADIDVNSASLTTQMMLSYDIGANARLQPKVGLNYSLVHLGNYKEHGGAIPLSVDAKNVNSLRPHIGGDIMVLANGNIELNAYGLYRYEVLDNKVGLRSSFIDASDMSFISEGEKTGRSSANIGVNAKVKVNNMISVAGGYDLMAARKFIGHQFYLQGNAKF
ncbi:autotransporter outer membrane beta-barrel domain-containing protein [Bartonella sp. HY329]|uniref:autotransporter family protein n=1 Tax=unclassified Bartonella TaxID=2645622 RepID=UPI0021C8F192|nr:MULTISPECIES: autotransporter outer membrane beta-barrel domain-containing protein [unclassified Bartonella]UXM96046.1 autotransporter outer membrane beta-barrel domain-containing protein [Bartonella sp. HY329]UXN10370.1 autotransporter outer membrane beta-barrel domain-containing protein [Bartonella sp. HY328]